MQQLIFIWASLKKWVAECCGLIWWNVIPLILHVCAQNHWMFVWMYCTPAVCSIHVNICYKSVWWPFVKQFQHNTYGEHGILLRWCSTQALWGRGSLLSWQSDAEHPSTSAQDWGKRHETEYHQTHPSFGPCSTPTETTEETLQLCVILWKETCRELHMYSSLVWREAGRLFYGAYSTFYQVKHILY